jgi:hypothetical protein
MNDEPTQPTQPTEPIEPERLPERPVTAAAPRPRPVRGALVKGLAFMLAFAVDALQIVIFPLFGMGAANPVVIALDLATAFVMWRLLGWHWAFLPTFAAELLPFIDLFPTWTLAVAFVMRKK